MQRRSWPFPGAGDELADFSQTLHPSLDLLTVSIPEDAQPPLQYLGMLLSELRGRMGPVHSCYQLCLL